MSPEAVPLGEQCPLLTGDRLSSLQGMFSEMKKPDP